jgi:hypothetical protein
MAFLRLLVAIRYLILRFKQTASLGVATAVLVIRTMQDETSEDPFP